MKGLFMMAFYVPFILLSPVETTVDRDKDSDHEVIEKIEQKYKELRKEPFGKTAGDMDHSLRFIQRGDMVTKNYSKLRQIALVRHGEPDMVKTGKFNAEEAKQFLRCYDSVCIIMPDQPFFIFEDKEDVKVFSSPINRAFTTAKYLCGPDKDISVSPDFREFETKINNHSSKRLPIKYWTTTARIKWMFGRGDQKGIESFSEAKKRAERAAQTLADASEKNPKVLLTAHGFLNRYIKKNLVKKGWKVVEDNGNDYLGTTILVKIE